MTSKHSEFRQWLTEKWFEHKEEYLIWHRRALTEYDMKFYISKYKWYLKSLYTCEKRKHDGT